MADTTRIITSLTHELRQTCEQGLVISADILFYAESTHGLGPAELESVLQDRDSEAGEELRALALTPDMHLRRRLEPLLKADSALGQEELEALVSGLVQNLSAFHLVIPGVASFDLAFQRSDVEYLVAKCYFDRSIDPQLARALDNRLPAETVIACRLVLRCRGHAYGARKRDFLCSYIEKSRSRTDRFVELFTLMVELLAQMEDGDPIEEYLLGRRRQLIKTLRVIREFEQKRDHYSMEYLMMQRYPIPHESEEQVLEQLEMVTMITDVILNLPADPSLQVDVRELGAYGRRADMSQIIRKLS